MRRETSKHSSPPAEPLKGEDGADGRHFCAPAVLGPSPALAETFDGRRAVIIDGDTFALGLERVRIGLALWAAVISPVRTWMCSCAC